MSHMPPKKKRIFHIFVFLGWERGRKGGGRGDMERKSSSSSHHQQGEVMAFFLWGKGKKGGFNLRKKEGGFHVASGDRKRKGKRGEIFD